MDQKYLPEFWCEMMAAAQAFYVYACEMGDRTNAEKFLEDLHFATDEYWYLGGETGVSSQECPYCLPGEDHDDIPF